MFPNRYFAPRYFVPRYWPGGEESSSPATASANGLPLRMAYDDRMPMTMAAASVAEIEMQSADVMAVTLTFKPIQHLQITPVAVIDIWMSEQ